VVKLLRGQPGVFRFPQPVATTGQADDPRSGSLRLGSQGLGDQGSGENDFIGGPENSLIQLALEAAVSSCRYNPILLYGLPGVGKSHLLHLLAAQYQSKQDLTKQKTDCNSVLSITGADFARAITAARELDALDDLRTKHRSVDWLILDDLQDIADKGYAQTELLHTIDERIKSQRQVLVVSRVSLAEFGTLLAGLKSRLACGLTLSVAKPEAAARRAIVDQFAADLSLELPAEVRDLLVHPSRQHARRLETVSQLKGLLLELSLSSERTVAAAQRVLAQSAAEIRFSTRQITTLTARHFRLKTTDLTGPSRRQATVLARGIAIYLVRKLTTLSLAEIGRRFGHRDHSTVLHSYRKTEQATENDPAVRNSIHAIADRLGAVTLVN
jgi:chromosomal replication initiator protein